MVWYGRMHSQGRRHPRPLRPALKQALLPLVKTGLRLRTRHVVYVGARRRMFLTVGGRLAPSRAVGRIEGGGGGRGVAIF